MDFGDVRIPIIHAPSFGKGGGETAIQLARHIASSTTPTVAIGDWNIDIEELWKEVEEDRGTPPHKNLFTKKGIALFPPPKSLFPTTHSRTWHRYRGDITKQIRATQKSGGTLDYAIAKSGLDVSVKIHVNIGNGSDHAAILVDINI